MKQKPYAALTALLVLVWITAAAAAGPVSLTILHTNDTHGHLLPFSYPGRVAQGSELAGLHERSDIGGIARRATLVKHIRAELKVNGTTVWLVDAGDFSDGTPFSIEYHGEADIAAMNAAGYDFATLGNHEFSYSLAQTQKLISLARHPILCANVTRKADGKPLTAAYRIETVGPLRIGLFGLLTKEANAYPAARQGLSVADEVQSARRMAKFMKPQADILIVLSHCGEAVDERIAEAVADIDVIVGGHSHSRLPSGKFVWHGDALLTNDVNGVVIVQNHQWGGELGRLDLLFVQDDQGRWHLDRYRARLIPITAAIEADKTVAAVVDRYWQPLAARYGEIIGHATADFVSINDDLAEYNLMADAIRATFNTDVVLENIGGVRAPLVKGPITRADLAAMDPFDNTIATFKIKGADLERLLLAHTPAVSGLRYRIQGRALTEDACGGRPLNPDKIYTGAVNSFVAGSWLKSIPVEGLRDTGRQRLEVLIDYIRRQGKVAPAFDGRRVIGP